MARANPPAVVLIDELDEIIRRSPIEDNFINHGNKGELLRQIEKSKGDKNLLVIADTNAPWRLGADVCRRLAKAIYIPMPDAKSRAQIFKQVLSATPSSLTEEDYEAIGSLTEGYSPADVITLGRDVAMESVRRIRSARKFAVDSEGFYVPTCPSDPFGIEYMALVLLGTHKVKCPISMVG